MTFIQFANVATIGVLIPVILMASHQGEWATVCVAVVAISALSQTVWLRAKFVSPSRDGEK